MPNFLFIVHYFLFIINFRSHTKQSQFNTPASNQPLQCHRCTLYANFCMANFTSPMLWNLIPFHCLLPYLNTILSRPLNHCVRVTLPLTYRILSTYLFIHFSTICIHQTTPQFYTFLLRLHPLNLHCMPLICFNPRLWAEKAIWHAPIYWGFLQCHHIPYQWHTHLT